MLRIARKGLSRSLALVLIFAGGGCGGSPVLFEKGPVISRVNDNADIPEPAEVEFYFISNHIRTFYPRQLRLRLDPVPPAPAEDVNRLGEVPSSSWYENRIEGLSPAAVARGPGGDDPGPEAFKPWTVTSWKSGGMNPGFVFEDARGVGYICKFDKVGAPVVSTAAGAVAARLMWACGYHVPDDRVVFFQRGDLQLAEKLQAAAAAGEPDAVTAEDIDAILKEFVARRANGDYRALVSRFLPGKPVGGFTYAGTRQDDPNDLIPHQNRRSLRGLRVFAAWLNHVDLKPDNTLDIYVEKNGRLYLEHYFVDFDACLGGFWASRHEQRIGYAYDVDLAEIATGLLSVGLIKRPYENFGAGPHPYIGLYEAEVYDPARWVANYPNDQVLSCNPADAYWAATVLARITREHIEAAVTAARFEDAEADSILAEILHGRWAKTVRWGLTRVTPVAGLDRTASPANGLTIAAVNTVTRCDLESRLAFRFRLLDEAGRMIWEVDAASEDPAVTIPAAALAGHDYVVARWTARDARGHALPPTEAHYLRDSAQWVLVGILRDGQ